MNVLKQFLYFVFSLQEKFLTNRLESTLKASNKYKRKKYYGDGCLLSLDSLADDERNEMEEKLRLILNNSGYEPNKVLEYIKSQGTKVYYIKNPKFLYAIEENEGFIYPQKGLKALYLSAVTNQKLKFKTEEMFVLSKGEINKYYFIYHLYNWYAFKHGISGLDAGAAEMLDTFLYKAGEEDINKLQLSDIYKLKDAIKQDKMAIEFVVKLCREFEGGKKALDKLQDGGADL